MDGVVQSIWRHPVKGFTPEPLDTVTLAAGAWFPFDRMYAVEDGPCGFDPLAPQHISKQKFTVLAKIASIARIRTRFDEATGDLQACLDGATPFRGCLDQEAGRDAFAAWLAEALGDEAAGRLKVLAAPPAHRFTDSIDGYVSIVSLASVRDLSERIRRVVDPLRFRANIYVDGWPAWSENQASGGHLRLGEVEAEVIRPITRCVATHVDPQTGERDLEIVRALFEGYGHQFCGVYAKVVRGGRLTIGDAAVWRTERTIRA